MELIRASDRLSQFQLEILAGNLEIDVLWFRAMVIRDSHWSIASHKHSSYEFHFIHSGSCRVILEDREFVAGENEFYLTSPGVYHEQESMSEEGFIEYCINCDLKLLDDSESEMSLLVQVFGNSPCRCVRDEYNCIDLFHKALLEADNQQLGFISNIKSLVVMILFSAARAIDDGTTNITNVPVKSGKNDYRMRQIEKFIDDNIYSRICTEDIANVMFLSSRQVNRIVKTSKGMSIKEYIDAKKHDKAKCLLKNNIYSIQEISNILGFSSEYYFSQFFKKREGYSPSDFRVNVNNVR